MNYGLLWTKKAINSGYGLPLFIATTFLASLPSNATVSAGAVSTHWSIENSLHWVLHVSFHEDTSCIRKDNSPENMAMLRHFALNLLSRDKSSKFSMRAKRNKAAWDLAYLKHLLNL